MITREGPHRFPHRQLLGWIYLGLGLIVSSIVRVGTWLDSRHSRVGWPLPEGFQIIVLFVIGLVIVFSLLWLWAGYALLTNKRAARPLTIAISSGLTVLSIGVSLALLSEMSASVLWLLPLALGIYGFVVARRIQPPSHDGAQVNR